MPAPPGKDLFFIFISVSSTEPIDIQFNLLYLITSNFAIKWNDTATLQYKLYTIVTENASMDMEQNSRDFFFAI